jgi:GNAT superfamily N-acetyltransferase
VDVPTPDGVRAAGVDDGGRLLDLWAMLFEEDTVASAEWKQQAVEWFNRSVDAPSAAHFPVIDADGDIVATAIGTLELGVPNPYCARGRVVRLANVITVPEHRGRGFGTMLARDVIAWARSIDADRVDLSSTPDGERIYEALGFRRTSAPRMKLVL